MGLRGGALEHWTGQTLSMHFMSMSDPFLSKPMRILIYNIFQMLLFAYGNLNHRSMISHVVKDAVV